MSTGWKDTGIQELRDQIAAFSNEVATKVLDVDNSPADAAVRPLDIKNTAQQGTGNEEILCVFHNYTDSKALIIDQVGSGNIIDIRNASNPTYRVDQGEDFKGTGNFLVCSNINTTTDLYETALTVDKDANFTFGDLGVVTFESESTNSGEYAFAFKSASPVNSIFAIQQGTTTALAVAYTNTTTKLTTASAAVGGMHIKTANGPVYLYPGNGRMDVYHGGTVAKMMSVQTSSCLFSGTIKLGDSSAVPTADANDGITVWCDTTADRVLKLSSPA